MIESVKTFVFTFDFYSYLALFTYWVPLVICFTTYFARLIKAYKHDISERNKKYYNPHLTIGAIFLMFFLSLTPVVNMFSMVFDCMDSVIKWIRETFNFALVKHRPTEDES